MWTLIRRAIVPLVLLLSAIASVIYGARYHRQPAAKSGERVKDAESVIRM